MLKIVLLMAFVAISSAPAYSQHADCKSMADALLRWDGVLEASAVTIDADGHVGVATFPLLSKAGRVPRVGSRSGENLSGFGLSAIGSAGVAKMRLQIDLMGPKPRVVLESGLPSREASFLASCETESMYGFSGSYRTFAVVRVRRIVLVR